MTKGIPASICTFNVEVSLKEYKTQYAFDTEGRLPIYSLTSNSVPSVGKVIPYSDNRFDMEQRAPLDYSNIPLYLYSTCIEFILVCLHAN